MSNRLPSKPANGRITKPKPPAISKMRTPTAPVKVPTNNGHATKTTQRKPQGQGKQSNSQTPDIAAWKKRPNWDMRGKISDMEALLKMNHSKIGELDKFRRDLQVAVEDKESETKAALQRAAELKAELQALERSHHQEVENLNAQQRIHHQELEDQNLILKRRLTTIEMEVQDDRRKLDLIKKQIEHQSAENDTLRTVIVQTSTSFKDVETEIKTITLKLRMSEKAIEERKQMIEQLTKQLASADEVTGSLDQKLQEEEAKRKMLLETIGELEQTAH